MNAAKATAARPRWSRNAGGSESLQTLNRRAETRALQVILPTAVLSEAKDDDLRILTHFPFFFGFRPYAASFFPADL